MGLYLYFRQVIQAHRRGQMRWSWLQWWWQWWQRCHRCQRWWWWRWQWGHLSRQRTCIVDNRCDATREDEDDACADESHPKLPPSTFAVTFHLSEKYTFWRDECEDDGEWGRWLIQRFKVQLFHPKMTIYNRSNNSDCHNALQWPLGSWWLQWSFPICIWVAAKYWWCYVANWCLLRLLQMPTLPLTTPVEINQEGHRKFVLSPHNRVTTVAPNYKNMIKVIKAQIYILTLYPGSRFCSASLPASPLPPVTMCAPIKLLPSAVSKPEMESWFPGLGSLTGQSGLEPLTRVGASSLG